MNHQSVPRNLRYGSPYRTFNFALIISYSLIFCFQFLFYVFSLFDSLRNKITFCNTHTEAEKKNLFRNLKFYIRQMFLHKVLSFARFGASTILIPSSFNWFSTCFSQVSCGLPLLFLYWLVSYCIALAAAVSLSSRQQCLSHFNFLFLMTVDHGVIPVLRYTSSLLITCG